jgi:hypothetical protein
MNPPLWGGDSSPQPPFQAAELATKRTRPQFKVTGSNNLPYSPAVLAVGHQRVIRQICRVVRPASRHPRGLVSGGFRLRTRSRYRWLWPSSRRLPTFLLRYRCGAFHPDHSYSRPFAWFHGMLSRIPAHSITPLTESPPHTRQPAAAPAQAQTIRGSGTFRNWHQVRHYWQEVGVSRLLRPCVWLVLKSRLRVPDRSCRPSQMGSATIGVWRTGENT